MKTYLHNITAVTPEVLLHDTSVLYDDKIIAVGGPAPADAVRMDGGGLTVWPGFVDAHTHGIGGVDVMDGCGAIVHMASLLPSAGVTAFQPATVSAERGELEAALDGIQAAKRLAPAGSEILGCHVEGPFLSREYAGAHRVDTLCAPAWDWLEPYAGLVRRVTVAPEYDGALEFIKICAAHGIGVNLGHTAATAELCLTALDAGADGFTHIFNAMSPLRHRQPGAVGAAMLSDTALCEVIADYLHLHPLTLKLLHRVMPERVALITDAMGAARMPPGDYMLGGLLVQAREEPNGVSARLPDGTLAGSVLEMNAAVRKYIAATGCTWPQAARAACENPAKLAGAAGQKGRLEPGCDADFALTDEALEVHRTIVRGQIIYERT